ncbi:MAG: amino acid transporter [Acidobacteria bacterium]|nr:MAG: amino acid transporter [Acidobacteriota bacterium]
MSSDGSDGSVTVGAPASAPRQFAQGLGLFDAITVVVGVMIGSGIFIVSADMARLVGSAGWLLVAWAIAGLLTIAGALSYGELSALMPRAGGMYIYLREAFSPLLGFLYGWTLFTVIQTGTIAAVSVAFARFLGVLWPAISEDRYLIPPQLISQRYAVSLSSSQLLALAIIVLVTFTNTRGLQYGKIIQNIFTIAKTGALLALIMLGLFLGRNSAAVHTNFAHTWTTQAVKPIVPGLAATTFFGLLVALCISQTGSLFAADSWHNIAFTASEVRNARRNVTLAMVIGTVVVISLYMLANVAYLVTLPLPAIQHAAGDRVATAMLQAIFPGAGTLAMAVAIMVSTFGCVNALIMTGARAYYAMACEGLFFSRAGRLNTARVPGWSLIAQGLWSVLLVLARTYNPASGEYGNLYSNLLEYIISAALLFYIMTVLGLFRLRVIQPDLERPYRAVGYPVVPALYVIGASAILLFLLVYRPATTWPGLFIVALGIPVYAWLRAAKSPARNDGT